MKTIIKKSIFTSLCAVTLLASGSQALGMFTTLYNTFTTKPLKKQSSPAHKIINEFAQQCYKTMSTEFTEQYKDLPRKKIDAFVQEKKILETILITQDSKDTIGRNNGTTIYLNKKHYTLNEDTTNLTNIQKIYICHEVAHSWLGHTLRNDITTAQKEFEAETLTIKTLYKLIENNYDKDNIIKWYLITRFGLLTDHYNNAYILGVINGIASLDTQSLTIGINEHCKIKLDSIDTTPKDKQILQSLQQLIQNWKPVSTYKEALAYANSQLEQKIKNPAIPTSITECFTIQQLNNSCTRHQTKILDTVATAGIIAGITYGTYKLCTHFTPQEKMKDSHEN